jgi:hypothetical protein
LGEVLIVVQQVHHGGNEHHAATNAQQADKDPDEETEAQHQKYGHMRGENG